MVITIIFTLFVAPRELKESLKMVVLQENENLLEFLDSNENEFRDETEIETVRADLTRIQTKLEELLKGGRQEGQV